MSKLGEPFRAWALRMEGKSTSVWKVLFTCPAWPLSMGARYPMKKARAFSAFLLEVSGR